MLYYSIMWLIGYYMFYFITKTLTRHWWWWEWYYIYLKSIHNEYVKKYLYMDNNSVELLWTWRIIAILNRSMWVWSNMLTSFFMNFVKLVLSLLFSIVAIWYVSMKLLLVFFLILFAITIWSVFLNKFIIKIRKEKINIENNYSHFLTKILMSKFEILQNNKVNPQVQRLDEYYDDAFQKQISLNNLLYMIYVTPSLVTSIIRILIFFVVGYWYINWAYSFTQLVLLISLLWYLDSILRQYIDYYKTFTNDFSLVKNLWETFDTVPPIKWYLDWKDFKISNWTILLDKISFNYWNNTVFENFVLNIPWKTKTALVWVSGSWKTTLVKMICGYIRPTSWKVIVDSQDLTQVNLKSYYSTIWYLSQDPSVFDGTVYDNLTFWISWNISEYKVHEIIKLSNCDFIYDFDQWLDTQIWERGIRLSWWQKQRLAIAKLMLKNPDIIVLDEPTSALDSISEHLITNALNHLFKWRTVIIIAHRLQTVKSADNIVVLDKWKIIEMWKHQELINQNWYYKQMLDFQSWILS